jgi:hypothetical protein
MKARSLRYMFSASALSAVQLAWIVIAYFVLTRYLAPTLTRSAHRESFISPEHALGSAQ